MSRQENQASSIECSTEQVQGFRRIVEKTSKMWQREGCTGRRRCGRRMRSAGGGARRQWSGTPWRTRPRCRRRPASAHPPPPACPVSCPTAPPPPSHAPARVTPSLTFIAEYFLLETSILLHSVHSVQTLVFASDWSRRPVKAKHLDIKGHSCTGPGRLAPDMEYHTANAARH